MFGEFVNKRRRELRLGLREFCIAVDYDPSNWSKIERGMLSPPQDRGVLNRIAVILKISVTQWHLLFDYAAIDVGRIPSYVLADRDFVKRLPIFFRSAKGSKPTVEELNVLAEILRKP